MYFSLFCDVRKTLLQDFLISNFELLNNIIVYYLIRVREVGKLTTHGDAKTWIHHFPPLEEQMFVCWIPEKLVVRGCVMVTSQVDGTVYLPPLRHFFRKIVTTIPTLQTKHRRKLLLQDICNGPILYFSKIST